MEKLTGMPRAELAVALRSAGRRDRLCVQCHSVGRPKLITRGSILIELVLWLCFLVPGLIYSIWRHTTRYQGCRVCGSRDLVPCDSPRATSLVAVDR